MKRLSSAQFRRSYARETAPIEVTAYGSLIGTWYPAGTDLPGVSTVATVATAPEEVEEGPRFSIRPMKRPRPEMTTHTVGVMDPLDVRRVELGRSEEIQPRVFKTRRI